MNLLSKNLIQKNSEWKRDVLLPFLKPGEKVLDFGCGDLTLAKSLKDKIPSLKMTGIDVVDFKNSDKNIDFKKYDGKKIPFKDNAFDTIISFYVFHHCDNALESYKECLRVAKRVIFIESVKRTPLEVPMMMFLDWIFNIWKSKEISLPFQFYSEKEWEREFKKNKVKKIKKRNISSSFFRSLPIGGQVVFETIK